MNLVSRAARSTSDANVVEVVTADYAFRAPSEIPSGWITFRMKNEGREHHFLLLSRLPDGKTFEDYQEEVATPFDTVWHALKTGTVDKTEAGQMLGGLLLQTRIRTQQYSGLHAG